MENINTTVATKAEATSARINAAVALLKMISVESRLPVEHRLNHEETAHVAVCYSMLTRARLGE